VIRCGTDGRLFWEGIMVSIQQIGKVIAYLSICTLLYACGGGGGGGGQTPSNTTNPPQDGGPDTGSGQTTPADAEVASAATKAAINALTFFDVTQLGFTKPVLKATENDAQQVRSGVNALYATLQRQDVRQKARYEPLPVETGCESGTFVFTEDDNDTLDYLFDDTDSESFTNCADPGMLLNGSTTTAYSTSEQGNGVTVTYGNLEETITDAGGDMITYERVDGTVTLISGTLTECPDQLEVVPDGPVTVSMDLTIERKEDAEGDGTLEYHEVFTMTGLTMVITETRDANCNEKDTKINVGGEVMVMDMLDLAGDDNLTVAFNAFDITLTPDSTGSGTTSTGDRLEFNGDVSISGVCINGDYTISTVKSFFYPYEGACPVEGKLTVTGEGSTVALTSTLSGGIEIDEGNNGSVESKAPDCKQSAFCSN
jgi:hypothetical protein